MIDGGSRISGLGTYRPRRLVGNAEICERIDSSDDWIRKRSGIETRHVAGADETVIAMAASAATKALAHAGVDPLDVRMVLVASISYLHQTPAAAPMVAHEIGATNAAAMDLSAACAGFCYGVGMADALVRAGHGHVLVIGVERMTDIVDPADRGAAFLFGDGAGAVVLSPAARPEVFPTVWGAQGEHAGLIAHDRSWAEYDGTRHEWPAMRMQGTEVFRWAIRDMPPVAEQVLAKAGVQAGELAAFVPHQANLRIIDGMAKAMRLPESVAVATDVRGTANTSAASIPLALETLLQQGKVASGELALLLGFGAGLTYAGQVIRVP